MIMKVIGGILYRIRLRKFIRLIDKELDVNKKISLYKAQECYRKAKRL